MGRFFHIGCWLLLVALSLPASAGAHADGEPLADASASSEVPPVHAREDRFAAFFGGDYVKHRTDHFRLYSNHAGWAEEAGDLLEYTHGRFYELWGDLVEPLEEPLTWLGFSRRDDFHRYAEEEDGMDMSWSDGYYSAQTNRVVVVHQTSRGQRRSARRSSRGGDGEVLGQEGSEEADEKSQTPALTDPGQVTHEAAHQMAFNSGLQRRGVMYPLWVSEGLATNFETNPDGEFGPDTDNPNRRRQLLRAWEGGRMMSLEDLVVLTRVPRSPGQSISEVYAQCWVFFQYLYTHHESQLKNYLEALSQKGTGRRRDRTLHREFHDSFGSLRAIEKGYHDFIREDVARR